MRTTVILAAMLLVLSTATGTALEVAIGGGYDYQLAVVANYSLTASSTWQQHTAHLDLRAWPYPLQLGVGISRVFSSWIASGTFVDAVLSADYWFLDHRLGSSPLSVHLGAGAWAAVPAFALGLRGVAGLRLSPIPADRGFELFLEIVPTAGCYLEPPIGIVAGASAAAGIRYWFGK